MPTPSTRRGTRRERGPTGTRRTPTIAGGRRCLPATRTTPIRVRGDSRAPRAVRRRAAAHPPPPLDRDGAGGVRLRGRHLSSAPPDCSGPRASTAGLASAAVGCTTAAANSAIRSARRKASRSRPPSNQAAPRWVPIATPAPASSTCAAFSGLGRHTVLAGRAALARRWGDLDGRRLFSAAGPGPSVAAFDFGRDTIGLLRGFAAEDVVGSRAAVANADLRFPLAYPQRGLGSWPIFPAALHAAVFVDAGNAWEQRVPRCRYPHVGRRRALRRHRARALPSAHASPAASPGRAIRSTADSSAAVFGRVGRAF